MMAFSEHYRMGVVARRAAEPPGAVSGGVEAVSHQFPELLAVSPLESLPRAQKSALLGEEEQQTGARVTKWIPCGTSFMETDVIRWKEAVWEKPRRRRARAVNAGERMVAAEVIRDEDGWVELLIRESTILSEKPGWALRPLPKDESVRRKRRTIERGDPERLRWSDEGARAALISKFLNQC